MLSVQPHAPIPEVKKMLLEALKLRGVQAINGDVLPEESESIELAILNDRSDPEKGWKRLTMVPETNGGTSKNAGRSGNTVLGAGLATGHWVAFRFRQPGETNGLDADDEETSWDVVLPTFDEGEEGHEGM